MTSSPSSQDPPGAVSPHWRGSVAGFIPRLLNAKIEGSAEVLGNDVESAPPNSITESIGMVFDNPFDQLTAATRTAFDETAYALENEGLPPAEIVDRVLGALESVGLAGLAGHHPRRLSGGQSQRLAIACALAQQKPILVLDDPTSQLDPTGTAEVVSMVKKLRREHTTVVLVAQDLTHWLAIADRLVILDGGRVTADGHPASLLTEAGTTCRPSLDPSLRRYLGRTAWPWHRVE